MHHEAVGGPCLYFEPLRSYFKPVLNDVIFSQPARKQAAFRKGDGLMNKRTGAENADHADQDPEYVQQRVRLILFQDGAPGQHDRIGGVDDPDQHERTLGPHPADQTEAGNAHQDTGHLNRLQMLDDKPVQNE